MAFLSKYGVARHIYIPIVKRGVVDFAVGADWTPGAGDVKISKDGGVAANATNLPAAIAMGNTALWDFSLTLTELQAAQIVVMVADAATKAVEDQSFIIETYGNASAQHAFDLATATVVASSVSSGGITSIVNAIWDESLAAHNIIASGSALIHNIDNTVSNNLDASITGIPGAVWGTAVPGLFAAGTAADVLGTDMPLVLAAVDTEVAAIKLKTDNLPSGIAKNVALAGFTFYMVDSTDHVTGKTLLVVTAQRSIDGAAFGACANAVAEIGSGIYKIDLAAADLNGNVITLKFTAAAADATVITVKTSA